MKIEQQTETPTKRQYGHRTSRSVSSLPLDLQNLSLQGPEDKPTTAPQQLYGGLVDKQPQPFGGMIDKQPRLQPYSGMLEKPQPYNGMPSLSNEKPPSWMLPNDTPLSLIPNNATARKARYNGGGHGRSVSEYSLPPLSSMNNVTPPPPSLQQQPQLLNATPRRVVRTHRRAVSANTVDFMLTPSPHSYHRAQSYSPQEQSLSNPPMNTAAALFDPLNETKMDHDTSGEGRYVCPYCQKKFSRPSSLRIHTYSHTGEKPFVCTEPGCGRRFSVQSNMRRHLRVHRGRPVNNSTLGTTNEENETI